MKKMIFAYILMVFISFSSFAQDNNKEKTNKKPVQTASYESSAAVLGGGIIIIILLSYGISVLMEKRDKKKSEDNS
jgi:hypothetical protein